MIDRSGWKKTIVLTTRLSWKKKENNLNSQIFDERKKGIREDRVPTK